MFSFGLIVILFSQGDDKYNRRHSEPFRRVIAEEVQIDEDLKWQNSLAKVKALQLYCRAMITST